MKNLTTRTLAFFRANAKFKVWIWFAAIAFLIALFFSLAAELNAASTKKMDAAILQKFFELRRPWLNAAAIDVTALGSTAVLTIVTVIFFMLMALKRNWVVGFHLVTAALGAAALGEVTKVFFGRGRPFLVPRLVEVQGFSYPSGHTLSGASVYLTMALLARLLFRNASDRRLILGVAIGLILLIGLSRIYLGAHFPSDVIGGMFLGVAWALFLNIAVMMIKKELKLAPVGL